MPKERPKTKISEKIKFFKIGGDGEIKPAFPIEHTKTGADTSSTQPSGELPPEVSEIAQNPLSKSSISMKESDQRIEEQLHMLKPHIEDIAKIPNDSELTHDQIDLLRKYIALKEAEVRDLLDQKRQYHSFMQKLGSQNEQFSQYNRDILLEIERLKSQNESLTQELRSLKDKHQKEMRTLKNDYEEKYKLSNHIESQAQSFGKEREDWKQKIREELKKIKLKERELENRYELLKRDSQTLLDSKDKHVLELSKKNDALELEIESFEERLRKTHSVLSSIDSKKHRLIETFKLAISLLEEIDQNTSESQQDEDKKAG